MTQVGVDVLLARIDDLERSGRALLTIVDGQRIDIITLQQQVLDLKADRSRQERALAGLANRIGLAKPSRPAPPDPAKNPGRARGW